MGNKGTCKAENCAGDVRAKGYCDRHYRKWRKGLMPKPRHRTCNQAGCNKARARNGLCLDHFASTRAKKGEAASAEAPPAPAAT